MLMAPMKLARQAGALVLWAATASRGLFAQQLPASPDSMQLRGVELRYVLPEPLFDNSPTAQPVKALYVNAWAFGSSKLAQLVLLADSTEINAFVVDVKDDTGCLLYPSEVKVAQEIGSTRCTRMTFTRSRVSSSPRIRCWPSGGPGGRCRTATAAGCGAIGSASRGSMRTTIRCGSTRGSSPKKRCGWDSMKCSSTTCVSPTSR